MDNPKSGGANPPGEPRSSGTVLMEAVLCLPLLLFLVTGIFQFARIWEARLLTRHAAYNAARAALVYNVLDYGDYTNDAGRAVFKFYSSTGAVWLAAVNTLAWKSETYHATRQAGADYEFPGFEGDASYRVANSAFIRRQVRIVNQDDRRFPDRASWESNGLVRATVQFDYPLLFSVFSWGSMWGEPEGRDDIGPGSEIPLVHEVDTTPRTAWSSKIPHFTLTESYVMPKPWSTRLYPRVSGSEKDYLEWRAR